MYWHGLEFQVHSVVSALVRELNRVIVTARRRGRLDRICSGRTREEAFDSISGGKHRRASIPRNESPHLGDQVSSLPAPFAAASCIPARKLTNGRMNQTYQLDHITSNDLDTSACWIHPRIIDSQHASIAVNAQASGRSNFATRYGGKRSFGAPACPQLMHIGAQAHSLRLAEVLLP